MGVKMGVHLLVTFVGMYLSHINGENFYLMDLKGGIAGDKVSVGEGRTYMGSFSSI